MRLKKQNLKAIVVGALAGIALYLSDWLMLFSHGPFFDDEGYFILYWSIYKSSYLVAIILPLLVGGPSMQFWIALVFPSLIIRHAQLLWQFGGPSNLWPPAFYLDVGMQLPIFLICYGTVWLREKVLSRFAARQKGL